MHPGTLKKSIVLNRWLIGSYLVMSMVACQLPLVKLVWPGWQWIGLMVVAITSLAVNEWLLKVLYKASEDNEKRLEKLTVVFPIFLALITLSAYAVTGDPLLTGFMALPVLQAHVVGLGKLAKRLFMGMLSFTLLSVLVGYPKPSLVLAQNPLLLSLAVIPLMVTLYQYGKVICGLVRITHSQVNHLQSLAATDGLTGLINRRQFNQQLQAEISRARRHGTSLSLALFDIDNFKRLNDVYGHPVGDRVLKELGIILMKNLRESDIPARYGGEEFALILPETRQVEAYDLLERLRAMVERTVFCLPENPITLTISVGLAQLDMDNNTGFDLVERADTALYQAKNQGKNRVIYGSVPQPKIRLY